MIQLHILLLWHIDFVFKKNIYIMLSSILLMLLIVSLAFQTQLDLSIQILDGLSRIIENIWKDIADYNRLTYMTITETTFVQHSDIESLDKRSAN